MNNIYVYADSDPDPDSQLSDHCNLEEDIEYSSDVLSDEVSNAHKELAHRKASHSHAFRQYKSEMIIPHFGISTNEILLVERDYF